MKKKKKEKDNWYHIRPHYYIHTHHPGRKRMSRPSNDMAKA
jgi:hypothetical protein